MRKLSGATVLLQVVSQLKGAWMRGIERAPTPPEEFQCIKQAGLSLPLVLKVCVPSNKMFRKPCFPPFVLWELRAFGVLQEAFQSRGMKHLATERSSSMQNALVQFRCSLEIIIIVADVGEK